MLHSKTFTAPGGTTFEPFSGANGTAGGSAAPTVNLVSADTLTPEPIDWLWPGWLAVGKLHLLAGSPGSGKTTIALALAAAVTSGANWPDDALIDAGDVLVWSGEDGVKDTLLPRFLASGGNAKRLHFVIGARHDGEDGQFDPSRHMAALEQAATAHRPKLLILDPVVSAVAADSHKNTEVRRGLQPVVDLAERLGCAVLGITHLSKNTAGRDPLERISGSIAFGAVARVALATVKPADPDAPRRLIRAKSNIGPDTGGFEYRLFSAPVPGHGFNNQAVEWGQPLDGSARELMAVEGPQDEAEAEDAVAFLSDMLRDGPVPTKELKAAAAAHGLSWRTAERAKRALGVEAVKLGMKEGWAWKLPPVPAVYEDRHDGPEGSHKIRDGGLRENAMKSALFHRHPSEDRQLAENGGLRERTGGLREAGPRRDGSGDRCIATGSPLGPEICPPDSIRRPTSAEGQPDPKSSPKSQYAFPRMEGTKAT